LGSLGSHGDFPFTLSAPSSGDLKPPRGQVNFQNDSHTLDSTRLDLTRLASTSTLSPSLKWTTTMKTMKTIITRLSDSVQSALQQWQIMAFLVAIDVKQQWKRREGKGRDREEWRERQAGVSDAVPREVSVTFERVSLDGRA